MMNTPTAYLLICSLGWSCVSVLAEPFGTALTKVRIENGSIITAVPVNGPVCGDGLKDTGSMRHMGPGEETSPFPPMPPDLTGSVTVSDGTGPDITFSYTITNSGDMGASNFHVYIVLSLNTTINSSDILVGDYVHSISGSHTTTYSSITENVADVTPGTYYLGIIVDATGVITESNESNNTGYDSSPQVTVSAWCDLCGSVSVLDGTAPDISYQFSLTNVGNVVAADFHIQVYLSKDATISPSADILIGDHTRTLAANSTYTSGVLTKHLPDLDPVTYYLGIYVDATHAISETDENNNTAYDNSPLIDMSGFPDLVGTVEVVSTSDPAAFTYSYTLVNRGGVNANDVTVYIVLSPDETIQTTDNLIVSRHFNQLMPMNLYSSGNVQANITAMSAGTYYLGLYADATHSVSESNEANNTAIDTKPQVTVEALPDLLVQSLDVTDGIGEDISYQCSIKNAGNTNAGKFTVTFYLSPDTQINSSDYQIDTWSVGIIMASGSTQSSGTRTTTVTGVPAGTYYLGAVADEADEVPESVSSNNSRYDDAPLVTISESTERFWADLDGDGDVDIADVQMVAGRWGCCTGDGNYLAICDVDGDGDIDVVDVQMVAGMWGTVV
ncbi:hypothetical protein JXO52_07425 [bacterium]|nr:hypothetical protein [bacterium]